MSQFPVVLAAVDASPVATSVLRFAQLLARADAGGRLFAVHAVEPPAPAWDRLLWPLASLGDDRPAIVAEACKIGLGLLTAQVRDAGVTLPTEALRAVPGAPADAVLAASGPLGPSLLVAGRYGRSGAVAGLLGSVASRLLFRAPIAVAFTDPAAPAGPPQRIAVAVAEGPAARASLELALELALAFGAKVVPVLVLDDPTAKNARNEARSLMTRLLEGQPLPFSIAGRLQDLLDKPRVLEGDAAEQILVGAEGCDLLVVGRTRGQRAGVGRTAESVVRSARVPVIVVPDGDGEAA